MQVNEQAFIATILSKKGRYSGSYVNQQSKFEITCSEGHTWMMTAVSIVKHNMWCDVCEKNIKLLKLHKIAKAKNGSCLALVYTNNHSKLEWKCHEATHPTWWATPSDIKSGRWCQKCAYGNRQKSRIAQTEKEMQKIITSRKGKFLSGNYTGLTPRYKWECHLGHIWEATGLNVIKNLSWCPECSVTTPAERTCRVYIEAMFGEKFPSSFPPWLRNEAGHGLQLDGYCAKLNLAFEYNGGQHYKRVKLFHKTEEEFLDQQKNDTRKIELCLLHKVHLIIIPNYVTDYRQFIVDDCKINNILVPFPNAEVDLSKLLAPVDLEQIDYLSKLVESKNGKILTTYFAGNNSKIMVHCNIHASSWETSPKIIKAGYWCPACGGVERKNLAWLHSTAQAREGICLADNFINVQTPVLWKCKIAQHPPWMARPTNVKHNGSWCPLCANENRKNKGIKK